MLHSQVVQRRPKLPAFLQTRGDTPTGLSLLVHRLRAALRSRHHRRRVISAGVVLVGLFTLLIVLGVAMARSTPTWWAESPTAALGVPTPEEIERGAVLENLIINRLYSPEGTRNLAGGVEWAVSLPEADVNAWLNTRLPKWLNNQSERPVWPVEVSRVVVRFEDGVIRLGARTIRGGTPQIYAATIILSLLHTDRPSGGELWLRTPWLWIGRLPVPSGLLVGRLRSDPSRDLPKHLSNLPQTKTFVDALAGEAPIVPRVSLKLEDGRRVRVTRAEVREGRLSVWCVTEAAR